MKYIQLTLDVNEPECNLFINHYFINIIFHILHRVYPFLFDFYTLHTSIICITDAPIPHNVYYFFHYSYVGLIIHNGRFLFNFQM